MRICYLCLEFFGWGKYGGHGRTARMVAGGLASRGHEVTAIVPRRKGQRAVECLDGVKVYSYPMARPHDVGPLVREVGADLYHSEEASMATWLAQRAEPLKKHMVTCHDPKLRKDLFIELRSPSVNLLRSAAAFSFENNFFVKRAVRRADGVFYSVHCVREKMVQAFALREKPGFLPVPIRQPRREVCKSDEPTVCFAARWDRRKRPHLFFELARQFPQVRFIAAGRSQDPAFERRLRESYGNLPNLEMPGFLDQFRGEELSELLGRSWILVNTSEREGLPNAFLEALAHQCAILSHVNPEQIVRRFGFQAINGDFAGGLLALLDHDRWREAGRAGYQYFLENYEYERAIDAHERTYRRILGRGDVHMKQQAH